MRERGFTLIEVLVVILLIGIIAGFAVLSIGNRATSDRLEREARRLQQVLRLAAEEAQVKGVEMGLERTRNGYRLLVNTPAAAGWVPIEGETSFGAREFEPPFEILVRAEGRLVPPPDPDATEPVPAILMLSSGEMTPFEIELRAAGVEDGWRVRGGPLGAVSLGGEAER